MNWRKNINLFLNGAFYFELDGKQTQLTCNSVRYTKDENCKLVARKISDMSDEEKMGLNHATGWTANQKKWDEVLDDYIKGEEFNSSYFYDDKTRSEWEESLISHLCSKISGFLYLLSIGVYPFNQNHNDIIWRYENTKS